jgi:hypothetical protein
MLGLPIVQWFAFSKFQTRASFLIPLAVTVGLMFVVSAFYPRSVLAEPERTNRRETGLRVGVLAAALALALVLPTTGLIILLRGVLTDILALFGLSHLVRVVQSRVKTDTSYSTKR